MDSAVYSLVVDANTKDRTWPNIVAGNREEQ